MRVNIVTSRDFNQKVNGEYMKVKMLTISMVELGYDVKIYNTSRRAQPSKMWGADVLWRPNDLKKIFKNYITHYKTSVQRAVFAIDLKQTRNSDLTIYSLIRTVPYGYLDPSSSLLDMADILSINFTRIARISKNFIKFLRYLEAMGLRNDERTLCKDLRITIVNNAEVQYLKKRGFRRVSNLIQAAPISMEQGAGCKQTTLKKDLKYDVLFLGPDSYPPNREAINYIDELIAPLLPQYKFYWVGENKLLTPKNVTALGFIEDIHDIFSQSKCMIAPIFSGTGVQNKILDALFLGLPVVTTRRAALPILRRTRDPSIHIANTPDQYAREIDKLCSSINIKNRTINDIYSIEVFKNDFKKIIDS